MALTSDISVRAICNLTGALDLAVASVPLDYNARNILASGVGAGQSDMIFHDTRTIAASGTDALDLAGVLAGPLGNTLTFARIKGLIIVAAPGNTNAVQLTRPASNGVPLFLAASDGIALNPGAVFAWVDPTAGGVAVTAGTGDLLNVANGGAGTSVNYDVIIIGASA